jgi:hypothetical protein
MSLQPIVHACGGELYAGGRRANIPAPGHSAKDRSISLYWSDGRVFAYSFGGADWRAALDRLRELGLIDPENRLRNGAVASEAPAAAELSAVERQAAARAIWDLGRPVHGALSEAYLRNRKIERPLPGPAALKHHGCVPLAIYAGGRLTIPALLAGILDPAGDLAGVEITYLDPGGGRARWPRLSRKTVGGRPGGSAVRLDPAAPDLLVAEGVVTALSASERFGLPAWALLSAGNLRTWTPPQGVRRVLIAGDCGAQGEASAHALAGRLRRAGVAAQVRLPPACFGDWNDAAVGRAAQERQGEGGGGGA